MEWGLEEDTWSGFLEGTTWEVFRGGGTFQ